MTSDGCNYLSSVLLVLGAAIGGLGASRAVRGVFAGQARRARRATYAGVQRLQQAWRLIRQRIRAISRKVQRRVRMWIDRARGRKVNYLEATGKTAISGSGKLTVIERKLTLEQRLAGLEEWREPATATPRSKRVFSGPGSCSSLLARPSVSSGVDRQPRLTKTAQRLWTFRIITWVSFGVGTGAGGVSVRDRAPDTGQVHPHNEGSRTWEK